MTTNEKDPKDHFVQPLRCPRAHVAFRARLDALGAHWEDLPPDTFREAGTSVRTCLVRLTMPT